MNWKEVSKDTSRTGDEEEKVAPIRFRGRLLGGKPEGEIILN